MKANRSTLRIIEEAEYDEDEDDNQSFKESDDIKTDIKIETDKFYNQLVIIISSFKLDLQCS